MFSNYDAAHTVRTLFLCPVHTPPYNNILTFFDKPLFHSKTFSHLLFLLFFIGLGRPVYAQSGCFSLTPCAQNTSVTFKCIDATAHSDIDYWITTTPLMANYLSSAGTTQYLVIKGFLNITTALGSHYTFHNGSEIIFADGNSGINITPGATLTVDAAYLHGCQTMWTGIKLQNSSSIEVINHSTISDAQCAIQTIYGSATLKVTDNTFYKNYCSLGLGDNAPWGSGGGILTITNNGISGNTFVGHNTVLANGWGYTKPRFAVFIEGVPSIKIGEVTGSTNYFADFDLSGARC